MKSLILILGLLLGFPSDPAYAMRARSLAEQGKALLFEWQKAMNLALKIGLNGTHGISRRVEKHIDPRMKEFTDKFAGDPLVSVPRELQGMVRLLTARAQEPLGDFAKSLAAIGGIPAAMTRLNSSAASCSFGGATGEREGYYDQLTKELLKYNPENDEDLAIIFGYIVLLSACDDSRAVENATSAVSLATQQNFRQFVTDNLQDEKRALGCLSLMNAMKAKGAPSRLGQQLVRSYILVRYLIDRSLRIMSPEEFRELQAMTPEDRAAALSQLVSNSLGDRLGSRLKDSMGQYKIAFDAIALLTKYFVRKGIIILGNSATDTAFHPEKWPFDSPHPQTEEIPFHLTDEGLVGWVMAEPEAQDSERRHVLAASVGSEEAEGLFVEGGRVQKVQGDYQARRLVFEQAFHDIASPASHLLNSIQKKNPVASGLLSFHPHLFEMKIHDLLDNHGTLVEKVRHLDFADRSTIHLSVEVLERVLLLAIRLSTAGQRVIVPEIGDRITVLLPVQDYLPLVRRLLNDFSPIQSRQPKD